VLLRVAWLITYQRINVLTYQRINAGGKEGARSSRDSALVKGRIGEFEEIVMNLKPRLKQMAWRIPARLLALVDRRWRCESDPAAALAEGPRMQGKEWR